MTPPAELNDSGSEKQGAYGQVPTGFEQMQRSLELESAKNDHEETMINSARQRKLKTLSDSSVLKMNAKKGRMSPIAAREEARPIAQNYKSHMDFNN